LTPVEEHSHGSGNVIVASAQVKPASASLSSGALVLFYQQITSSTSSAGLIGDHVAPVAITRSVEPVASERIAPRNLDLNAPRISAQQRMGGIVLSITIDVDLIADQVDEILQI